MVFVNQGTILRSQLTKAPDEVDQRALERAMFLNSFKDVDCKQDALQSYYKYTMFHHPLERLASSFRSKVERIPLHGLRADHQLRHLFNSTSILRSQLTKAPDEVDQRALERAMFPNSFKDVDCKQDALQSYYKYTMFHHPLERLASSFRSKVERIPLHGLRADHQLRHLFNSTSKQIRSMEGRNSLIKISFVDFVKSMAI